jgi:hypothetical protein
MQGLISSCVGLSLINLGVFVSEVTRELGMYKLGLYSIQLLNETFRKHKSWLEY